MHEKKKQIEITRHILRKSQEEKVKYTVTILGKKFIVYPNVFSPKYFSDGGFFVRNVSIQNGEIFLDVGCGTGIYSIFAALKGASKAIAIDINPAAVKNTKENVEKYNLTSKIKVLRGDLFEPLKKTNVKFDTIFFDTPFLYIKNKHLSLIERAVFDPQYETMGRFLKEAKKYLKKNGKIFIGFSSTMGHIGRLKNLIRGNKYKLKLIKEKTVKQKSHSSEIKLQLFEVRL